VKRLKISKVCNFVFLQWRRRGWSRIKARSAGHASLANRCSAAIFICARSAVHSRH